MTNATQTHYTLTQLIQIGRERLQTALPPATRGRLQSAVEAAEEADEGGSMTPSAFAAVRGTLADALGIAR